MTKKYFFKLGNTYASSNKMDSEINKFISSLDASLINSTEDLEEFKNKLENKVKEIHEKHPRCKEITLSIWSYSGRDQSLICGCTRGTIYNVDQDFKTSQI